MENNISEMETHIDLSDGATFWGYISPTNNSLSKVTKWRIEIRQLDGNWSDTIHDEDPDYMPQTPGLAGLFSIVVIGSGPNMPERQLSPIPESNAGISCNSNCAAMIGIVANADGTDASYWTVWDAYCH